MKYGIQSDYDQSDAERKHLLGEEERPHWIVILSLWGTSLALAALAGYFVLVPILNWIFDHIVRIVG